MRETTSRSSDQGSVLAGPLMARATAGPGIGGLMNLLLLFLPLRMSDVLWRVQPAQSHNQEGH